MNASFGFHPLFKYMYLGKITANFVTGTSYILSLPIRTAETRLALHNRFMVELLSLTTHLPDGNS